MKYFLLVIILLIMSIADICKAGSSSYDDVYLIFYATHEGKTGHVGIAIDNYRIEVIVSEKYSELINSYDTVPIGNLTYFDLWPKNDFPEKLHSIENIEARYNKLPKASWEKEISIHSIYYNGLPHAYKYPCDGIIRIESSPMMDYKLMSYLDSVICSNPPFNIRNNNCSDFIEDAIEVIVNKDLDADEMVMFKYSTTPNQLFKAVAKLEEAEIIKDPGDKVSGKFWSERILKRYINNNNSN